MTRRAAPRRRSKKASSLYLQHHQNRRDQDRRNDLRRARDLQGQEDVQDFWELTMDDDRHRAYIGETMDVDVVHDGGSLRAFAVLLKPNEHQEAHALMWMVLSSEITVFRVCQGVETVLDARMGVSLERCHDPKYAEEMRRKALRLLQTNRRGLPVSAALVNVFEHFLDREIKTNDLREKKLTLVN